MENKKDPYTDLRPYPGEERYVEFDDEFECWSVFGADSGFCYAQCGSQESAEERALT